MWGRVWVAAYLQLITDKNPIADNGYQELAFFSYRIKLRTKTQMKNDEPHSRREFFKRATKKTLPVIGLLSITGIPLFGQILNNGTLDCNGGCSHTCAGTARGMCDTCSHLCLGGCQGTSKGKVQDSTEIKNDTVKKTNGCNDNCRTECRVNCSSYCFQSCDKSCYNRCGGTCMGTCYPTCQGTTF